MIISICGKECTKEKKVTAKKLDVNFLVTFWPHFFSLVFDVNVKFFETNEALIELEKN